MRSVQASDDNNHEDHDQREDEHDEMREQERSNKRKLNRSHLTRVLAKNRARANKMFKTELGRRRKSQQPCQSPKKNTLTLNSINTSPFSSLGSNLSIMTSGLDGSSLTSQSIAAATAANASATSHPNPTLAGSGQSPQLTQAAFAAATAALATAAAATGMPVNQLITQVRLKPVRVINKLILFYSSWLKPTSNKCCCSKSKQISFNKQR